MAKFKAPEKIKDLDNEALESSINEAIEAASELSGIDDAELSDEQVEELEALGAFFAEAQGEQDARTAEANARAEKIASLRSAIPVKKDEDDVEDAEGEDDEEDKEKKDDKPFSEDGQEPEVAAVPKTDAASARRTVASRAARKATKQEFATKAEQSINMVAAADVPGYSSGQKFSDLSEAGKAILTRLNGLPKSGDKIVRNGAVVFQMPTHEFSQDNWRGRDSEMLLSAASESRLEGGNLVAAGGWGAPSETVLDFCKIETTEGLIQLPEVTITRGGVNYTKGPVFADVFNAASGFWDMDEATAEAGTELKTSYRPEVPGFIEKRLDAVGVMMEAGLLTRAGWPELVDRYAELGLTAHQHKMARKVIGLIQEYTGAAISAPNGFGNALDILHVLEVVATGERERNVMSLSATLEVLLPHWMRNVIRVDLAQRTGVENFLNVSDAQINAFFTSRNLRVQWLYDYQNLTVDPSGIVTAYPTAVEAIMYPAGTYVKGVADVITLDTIYDSTNLKKNDYVHLFVEQGLMVTNPCGDGRRISIPLAINGRTAAADLVGNFGVAPEPVV